MKYCTKCGKQIHDDAVICPSCGCLTGGKKPDHPSFREMNDPGFRTEKTEINIYALLGFIFGLVSWVLNFWGTVGIVAIVLSGIALSKKDSANTKNKIFAIVGLFSGIINVIYAFLQIIHLNNYLNSMMSLLNYTT